MVKHKLLVILLGGGREGKDRVCEGANRYLQLVTYILEVYLIIRACSIENRVEWTEYLKQQASQENVTFAYHLTNQEWKWG